ncbi:MAG: histidine kinase, partial [Cyclobacteriaceae bacterium]
MKMIFDHIIRMKKIILISVLAVIISVPLFSQVHYAEKGLLKIGIKVTLDEKVLPVDSLCDGFEPGTNLPRDLVIPEGSSLGVVTDSIGDTDIALIINNEPPTYINRPPVKMNGFSMSSSPGSRNSYTFVDETNNDTLKIAWTVGYAPVTLADLYPAEFFTKYVARQFQYIFESYPDTSQFNWSEETYIDSLNERGIPVNPKFPYSKNGVYFVVDEITEDAVIMLEGYHDELQRFNPDEPFSLFLYENLSPGDYTFVAYPYEGAPENLVLRYPFEIRKPWWQKTIAVIGFSVAGVSLIAGLFFIGYRSKVRKKERELQFARQLTEAELKAIRAQLNPHFLFNALSSIQNLVSEGRTDDANLYINKLSRLLRQVLSSSEQTFHELREEIKLTKLYLELEQLRFSFQFDIDIADD